MFLGGYDVEGGQVSFDLEDEEGRFALVLALEGGAIVEADLTVVVQAHSTDEADEDTSGLPELALEIEDFEVLQQQ